MFRQKLLTYLGAITAVSAAIADHIDKISHTTALWITLLGAVAMAAGGAISKAMESTLTVTVIGVLVAAFGVLAQAGNLIGDKWAQIAVIVGAALTAIGKSLFGIGEGDAGATTGGFSPRFGALLLFCLILPATQACDWKKSERPLVSAGYNFQITDLATAKVISAVKTYKPGSISSDTARKYFNALQKTSQVGQNFSLAIDRTVEVNPQTKGQLLDEATRYIDQVDAAVAVIDPADVRIRQWFLVARALASSFKLAVSAIEVPTPTAKVIADVSKAKATATANVAGSRDINDTVNLINALGAISADFSADVLAQKGLDAAALRTQRDVKYQAVQTFISAELAKL